MKLYYTPGTISLAVHIALEMSDIDYQAVAIDFSKNEQRSLEFLAVNPLGRVPALVTSQGVISEAPAILNYIQSALMQNSKSLLFNAGNENYYRNAQIDSFNSFMSSTVHVGHAHLWRAQRWVDEEQSKEDMAKKTPHNMAEYFSLIEERLFVGPWVHGEQFSSSDLYLFVVTRWLKGDGVDYTTYPRVSEHHHKMLRLKEVDSLLKGLYA
jgi:glutathione S-transferase